MESMSRRTLTHGAIGAVVGVVLGFVPIVLLVAPLIAGGVAGFLERRGPKRGALAGGIAGLLMAALSAVVVALIVAVRFGDMPVPFAGAPLRTLLAAGALSLAASLGQVLVAAIGGALAGLTEADRRRIGDGEETSETAPPAGAPFTAVGRIVGSFVVGVVVFAAVALGLTAALDPFVWPSALVGLPAGVVAGAAVAAVVHHFLVHRRDPETTMNWGAVGAAGLAIAVVFALVVGGLLLLGEQRKDATTESTYEYHVTIAADDTIENATFYLPAPVDAGTDTSELGVHFVETVQYDRTTPGVEGYEPPADPAEFEYDLVETEHGPMVAIAADRIEVTTVYYRTVENGTMGYLERIEPEAYDPDDPSMGILDDGSFRFTIRVAANDTIDTADPFESEPLLGPKTGLDGAECRPASQTKTKTCYEYASLVYADYDTDADTTVHVAVELSGSNEWFSGGWSGNEYRDRTHVEPVGPQSDWVVSSGELEVGVGTYR